MKITFFGGTGEVTGSNYLVESGETKVLVDCGLHQGEHFSARHNWEAFPYDPKGIDAVFVTHAHLDHTGRLPKLVKEGLRGRVHSTPPTRDFANLLLLDSEHVLLDEAQRTGNPPLYGVREVEDLMGQWDVLPYHQPLKVGPMTVTLYNAGHILGSSIVVIEAEGKRIAFSGDLGNSPAPIIGPYELLGDLNIDCCVIESAYGDRIHDPVDEKVLEDLIEETVKNGGVLMIPAFAMERTQKLLFTINELVNKGKIPRVPVYLDSPLAIKVTEVYKKYTKYFDASTKALMRDDSALFEFPGLHKALTTEQSKEINDVPPPKIVIAGSGMSHGGRILHHEKRYLPDPKSAILFVGYQADKSLGRKIRDGVSPVRILGDDIPVRCKKVSIEGYSAHADQRQLLAWLSPMRKTLMRVFVVQGEEEGSDVLAHKITEDLGVAAEAPQFGRVFEC
ncbi:MBL fold metallo-hydrolase [Patescibacteria group bacterium]|nr:MBL fold metallo-hydrolase [Patescibacteria group bacterium]